MDESSQGRSVAKMISLSVRQAGIFAAEQLAELSHEQSRLRAGTALRRAGTERTF